MKNICFVIRSMSGGGIETVTLNLAEKLILEGVNVTFILLSKGSEGYAIHPDIKVFTMQNFLNSPFGIISRSINKVIPLFGSVIFSKYFSKKFDSFFSNLQIGVCDKIFLCGFGSYTVLHKTTLENVVFQCHNTNSILLNKLSSVFFRFSKVLFRSILFNKNITCVSKGILDDLIFKLNIKPKSSCVVYNLIPQDKLTVLASHKCEIEKPYIIHVGRFVPEKNHKMLIEAYSNLNLLNKPKLILLGTGPTKILCENYVKSLGLEQEIKFLGFIKNPYPYIKNAQLLVLCSQHEGLPTVLIEAQLLNTYCISSDCPSGPSEIIRDDKVGKLFKVGDVNELAYMIKDTLVNSGEILQNDINISTDFDHRVILNYYLQ